MKVWVLHIAVERGKKQIVLGLELTGHYWFCLATWMIANGISVVQVNPYAVKQTKELEVNSQYGMPYLSKGVYAEPRQLSMIRDQLTEDRIL